MKILIISGFLGAGKTTFIQYLSKITKREMVILENEYSSLDIDSHILRDSPDTGNIDIWEMTEGCICCSTKKSFAESVLTISNTLGPEYLVIEPTGVGVLSNIIKNLQQIEYERITLLAPVTIVDGNNYEHCVREYSQLCKDQIRFASTIVISKTEHISKDRCSLLEQKLREWNPDAQILSSHYSGMESGWFQQLLDTKYDGSSLKSTEITEKLPTSFSLKNIKLNTVEQLIFFMEQLIRGHFGDILRAKGYISVGNLFMRFDMVNSTYSITGATENSSSKAVFIGKNIHRMELRRFLYLGSENIKIRKKRNLLQRLW